VKCKTRFKPESYMIKLKDKNAISSNSHNNSTECFDVFAHKGKSKHCFVDQIKYTIIFFGKKKKMIG